MRKTIFVFFLLFSIKSYAYGQELPNLKTVKLNKRVSYKQAEPTVIKVVAYLFKTPIDKKNKARNNAGQFLIEWMNGTPDYIFYLEEKETSFFNTDSDLLLMYMAALTKFSLEHPAEKEKRTQALGAMNIVLPYLYQQSDNKSWTKELWQLYDASKNGKLKEFLYH
ncbi:hypothetical protein [Pedobacter xixiisoli]|uniref:Uncharacterized protein n=1 Tax=Pedobacter xixiisoli TaxID=1476464 RepID=A0A286A8D9_9SPHI|nr:hypothetical protein [Pedobacter xixiisoli]SOD18174.1 hypothetical protein SAMN06297358_2864 [Pedobacter xixiisoli]